MAAAAGLQQAGIWEQLHHRPLDWLGDDGQIDWSRAAIDLLIDAGTLLPEVAPSSGAFGTTDPGAFLGISAPIAGVAGDQQAALVGQACFEAGDVDEMPVPRLTRRS